MIAQVRHTARGVLSAAWRSDAEGLGYCVPNATTYPWQWLWDSCFHAVAWAHLGDERGVLEVTRALSVQDDDGFVPHLIYRPGPSPHAGLWGTQDTSSITQPPMYGHAIAELTRTGFDVPGEVIDRAHRGMRFLLHRRQRSVGGLVELCHPWESGCDDSPRWDSALATAWTAQRWYEAKGELVRSIERSPTGAPLANPRFRVGSVAFSALVAWNATELASITSDDELRASARELEDAIDARWDADLLTWVDDGLTAGGSGRVRTLEALLPLLVRPRPEVFDQLIDPVAFGAACGPRGVHAAEPAYEPTRYWRGPAWPQLTYLLWSAGTSGRGSGVRASLVRSMVAGASRSGFAEFWEPESGEPLGAVPQSWTALSCVMVEP